MNCNILKQTRLKKSLTPYTYKGETVYVFRHREDEKVVVSKTIDYKEVFTVDREEIEQSKKQSKPVSVKPLSAEKKSHKDGLNQFYEDMAQVMPFNCMECGKPLYAFNKFAQRSCTAHILPKSLFPTIATNLHNIFFLGADLVGVCNHHDQWDKKGADHRKTMNVYTDALESFTKYLRHELTDKELVMACDYLAIDWKAHE